MEKDYWVTVALYEIFHSTLAQEYVFKGGTALSKCYKLIDRFSEDIDIVVLRREGESENQVKKKLGALSKLVGRVLPEIEVGGLTNKRGNIRKTVHQYHKLFDGGFGQAREHVVVEVTSLGSSEPFVGMPIHSYIGEMMESRGLNEQIQAFNMAPFTIQVLSKSRTFCEKIMSLVRFSHSDQPIYDLKNKIRHVYDLHQMLQDQEIGLFFQSPEFDVLLNQVGQDDVVGYKNNNLWLATHPVDAMIFAEATVAWDQLRAEYNGRFKNLVIGALPLEDELLKSLHRISERLRVVNWTVKLI